MQPVRKAVLPVAGLGTRFLPATKAMPKEMLTVVDRPVLQYVVDEAIEAGIEQFVFVTGRNKGVIEDHFDIAYELEATLRERGKTAQLQQLQAELPPAGNVSFTRQQAPLGLGHAVWCARHLVGDEPFALLLPDVLIKGERGCMAQMMDVYNEHGTNVIAVEEVAPDRTDQYGVVEIEGEGDVFPVTGMVEKPPKGTAPSNLIITGRYILKPRIFDLLAKQEKGAGGEIQITDSMLTLMREDGFMGLRFQGTTYDCGSKIGFLGANLAYGLDRGDLGPLLRETIRDLVG
ncbi:UTP--glucose-1-phosphate uridylyltransferase GalU [Acuticoccus kandeliae]|uniref:UTP--glucose-1-phosphate uridylyltransferase GalU n=1 Tax=Acuticoccus kandeliae TaxID=2073160 RepID=UPI000D3EAE98|nr:UTP--glucose-1-phosphate uridylyltransferase GalU [Acuticoccus kandeliae]